MFSNKFVFILSVTAFLAGAGLSLDREGVEKEADVSRQHMRTISNDPTSSQCASARSSISGPSNRLLSLSRRSSGHHRKSSSEGRRASQVLESLPFPQCICGQELSSLVDTDRHAREHAIKIIDHAIRGERQDRKTDLFFGTDTKIILRHFEAHAPNCPDYKKSSECLISLEAFRKSFPLFFHNTNHTEIAGKALKAFEDILDKVAGKLSDVITKSEGKENLSQEPKTLILEVQYQITGRIAHRWFVLVKAN